MVSAPDTKLLAHFELRKEIGRGGMGVVYEAFDTKLLRTVAIKVLPALVADAPTRRARLLREAQAAAKLNHPAIATVYEIGEARTDDPELAAFADKVIYIVMEYVEGVDLRYRLEAGLRLEEAVDFARQIAEGLASAHRAGVVHRDLKPGNIRVTPDGRVKILDFGLAKVAWGEPGSEAKTKAALTRTGVIVGTVPYMAPEQFQGTDLDERADLFSLGVILYQMLTGQLPFQGARLVDYVRALAKQELESPSKSNPAIPDRLGRLVEALLAQDPNERVPSAVTVGTELAAIAQGDPGSVPTLTESIYREALRPWRRRWSSIALACFAVVAAVGWGLYSSQRAAPPIDSLAVLPFENRTAAPELDAYYEGIGATLIRQLSRISGLNVVSERDVRRYRDTDKTVEQIARELGVGTLIQGYVQGNAETVRVVAQLMNAVPTVALWDGEVEGDPDQLLELQQQLVDQVLRNLPVSLSTRQRKALRRDPTSSREAYGFYSRGDAALRQIGDTAAGERAVGLFERAIETDPEFSWAHAGLSAAWMRRFQDTRSPGFLSNALEAADRAVELEPDAPELRITRASARRSSGWLEPAIEDIEIALTLNPDLDVAYRELAQCYWQQGEQDLAEQSYRRALDLRPQSWLHWNELGGFSMRIGRYEEAREQLTRAAELAPPEVIRPLENLGTLDLHLGDFESALATYRSIPVSLRNASLLANMGSLAFMLSQLEESRDLFQRAVDLQPEEPVHWGNLGDAQLQLGDSAAAHRSYVRATDAAAAQLQANPSDNRLRSLYPMLLAKAGQCKTSTRRAADLRPAVKGSVEELLLLSKAFALCDARSSAVETVLELLDAGVPAERLRAENELAWVLATPELALALAD
ncbi:MAG: protein kinase [Acidobacteriota bacterium]